MDGSRLGRGSRLDSCTGFESAGSDGLSLDCRGRFGFGGSQRKLANHALLWKGFGEELTYSLPPGGAPMLKFHGGAFVTPWNQLLEHRQGSSTGSEGLVSPLFLGVSMGFCRASARF